MRIRFVEPKPPNLTVYDQAALPRLGLPLLGRVLAGAGNDVRIYVETLAPIDWNDVASADLVGFSATTATAPAAYRMADHCRTALRVPTVIGGSHVTFLPGEGLDHCDFVVRGEGQRAIIELVELLRGWRTPDSIEGLSYRDDAGAKRHNLDRPWCSQEEYAALPAPDLSLIAGYERMSNVPIMTQWGCPFSCDFCSVIKMFGRHVRFRNVDDVLAELETFRGRDSVFFYDDNFVVDKRRTSRLLSGMVARDFDFRWSAQMRADTIYRNKRSREVDHEFLALMRRSGAQMVYCGFESINEESLKAYHKNQDVDTIRDAVRVFHRYGIAVHGMFVVGSDADEIETLQETTDFAQREGIDTIQLMMLTPCPGTDFYERMKAEGRLLSRNWILFDGHHCVIAPKKMRPDQLQEATHHAMVRFYGLRRSIGLLVKNGSKHLPFLLRLLIAAPFGSVLTRRSRQRLRDIFLVPALRIYARKHIRMWARRADVRAHLAFLRSAALDLRGS